ILPRPVHRDDPQPAARAGPRPAPAPRLPLQRQIGNRAFAALVARDPAPSFSGNVFLPGDENVGHSFRVEGTNIVEGTGKAKRIVATIDADGRYTRLDDKGAAIAGGGGGVRDLVGSVSPKAGKKDELVGDVDVTGRYRVKLGGQVVTGSLTDQGVAAHDIALKRTDGKKAADQLQIGHDPVPEGILVLPEGKFTVKGGQMTPAGGKRVQGSVTVIRRGAGLDQLTLTARYYEESHIAGYQGWVEHETDLAKR